MEKLSQSELVTILLGKLTDEVLKQTDIMVISPGIPVDSAFVEDIKKAGIPVWSEIELAYYFGKGKIAAITGTNGKTTTTALVGEIVKAWNPKTIVVGNIGIPYTELCDTTDDDSATIGRDQQLPVRDNRGFSSECQCNLKSDTGSSEPSLYI